MVHNKSLKEVESDESVHPVVHIPADGKKRILAEVWQVVRPNDDPDTEPEVIATGLTEEEAFKKASRINDGVE